MTLPLFSRSDSLQFGSFHYPLGLVEYTLSPKATAIFQQIIGGEEVADVEEDALHSVALEFSSLFHEMRHYVDMFGTTAGITLFDVYMQQIKDFAATSDSLRAAAMRWSPPLATWGADPGCPPPIRNFIRDTSALGIGTDLFISPFKAIEVDGHLDAPLVELDYELGGKADAFPVRVVRVGADHQSLRTILYPVGVEALTEANAHAIARSLVEHYFPKPIGLRFQNRFQTLDVDPEDQESDQLAARAAMSYMVVDLMITRVLKGRGIQTFPRDLVLALVDRVLSTHTIQKFDSPTGATAVQVERVGQGLLNLIETEPDELLKSGAVSEDPVVLNGYKNLLAILESGGDWTAVDDDYMPLSSMLIWETYVRKHVMVPLLRERIASKGRSFSTQAEFVGLLSKIGDAPVRVANGKLFFNMPTRVQQAWWHQLMAGQILRQMILEPKIYCPRAIKLLPGIDRANLAFEESCDAFMRLGCGTFRVDDADATIPNCLFEKALEVFALERSSQ